MAGSLLVAYSNASTHVAAAHEYLAAFGKYSSWDVSYINVTDGAEVQADLNDFDAVLHSYCARLCFPDYVSPSYKDALKNFRGVRVLAVQDEYDRVNATHDAILGLNFHIVLSVVPREFLHVIYPLINSRESNSMRF
jgi:hypothetical protein